MARVFLGVVRSQRSGAESVSRRMAETVKASFAAKVRAQKSRSHRRVAEDYALRRFFGGEAFLSGSSVSVSLVRFRDSGRPALCSAGGSRLRIVLIAVLRLACRPLKFGQVTASEFLSVSV